MSSPPSYEFLFLFFFLAFSLLQSCFHGATTFRLDVHHRFSDPVKRWAAERSLGGGFRPEDWPERGSVDYYAALAAQDRTVLGHRMMSFSEGNSTFQISTLGFLHYTTVALGMPSQTYMVALDTGSDLFWVPCDCIRCAPTSSASYGFLYADLYYLMVWGLLGALKTSETASLSGALALGLLEAIFSGWYHFWLHYGVYLERKQTTRLLN